MDHIATGLVSVLDGADDVKTLFFKAGSLADYIDHENCVF